MVKIIIGSLVNKSLTNACKAATTRRCPVFRTFSKITKKGAETIENIEFSKKFWVSQFFTCMRQK